MKPISKKRKSALLQNLVRDKILKAFPHLRPADVVTQIMVKQGQT